MKPCETPWYKEAASWVREFWNAKESYEFAKTRSALATSAADKRMRAAVGHLERLGVVWLGRKMPTRDEFEWGCGVREVPAQVWVWTPKAGDPLPWDDAVYQPGVGWRVSSAN